MEGQSSNVIQNWSYSLTLRSLLPLRSLRSLHITEIQSCFVAKSHLYLFQKPFYNSPTYKKTFISSCFAYTRYETIFLLFTMIPDCSRSPSDYWMTNKYLGLGTDGKAVVSIFKVTRRGCKKLLPSYVYEWIWFTDDKRSVPHF